MTSGVSFPRIRLLRGRVFSRDDRAGLPRVAIVGESTARSLGPGQDPIGTRIWLPTPKPRRSGEALDATQWRPVIGVVADVH
jgi:hypothetical protein